MAIHGERLASAVLTLSALAIAGAVVHRQFVRPMLTPPASPRYVSTWKEMVASGLHIGSPAAPVKVVEFVDFECPFCRVFHTRYAKLSQRFGDSIALVLVHSPGESHQYALPFARAAECAAAVGKLPVFVDLAFATQDSIGLKSWGAFARDMGVADTVRFTRCATDTSRVDRIEAGRELRARHEVRVTPTVFVNGWRFSGLPPEAELRRVIAALLDGQVPFPARATRLTANDR